MGIFPLTAKHLSAGCIALLAAAAHSNVCDGILSYGVFDQYEVTAFDSRWETARSAVCKSRDRSGGATIPVEGVPFSMSAAEAKRLCESSSTEASHDQYLRRVVKQVNEAIVEAWSQCVASRSGIYHAIFPSSDPTYRILWHSPSPGFTNSMTVAPTVVGAESCRPAVPNQVTLRHQNPASYICTRLEPEKTVVTAAVNGVDGPAGDIKPIELAAYEPDDDPPPISLKQCLAQGTPSQVVFTACNQIDMGTIHCHYNYRIQYNNTNQEWTMRGLHHDNGVRTYGNYFTDVSTNKISAWGSVHEFRSDGRLYRNQIQSGRITCPVPR